MEVTEAIKKLSPNYHRNTWKTSDENKVILHGLKQESLVIFARKHHPMSFHRIARIQISPAIAVLIAPLAFLVPPFLAKYVLLSPFDECLDIDFINSTPLVITIQVHYNCICH